MESRLVRQVPGKMRHWDVRFIRDFNDWELDMVASFLHCLDSHIPNREDGSQLLTTFSSSLFNWSRAYGFTNCDSIMTFIQLSFVYNSFFVVL